MMDPTSNNSKNKNKRMQIVIVLVFVMIAGWVQHPESFFTGGRIRHGPFLSSLLLLLPTSFLVYCSTNPTPTASVVSVLHVETFGETVFVSAKKLCSFVFREKNRAEHSNAISL
jgi:hypothetical protein